VQRAARQRELKTSRPPRYQREHGPDKPSDSRSEAQRDRDRIFYTPAFRRLADVTQTVSASEGPVFHNRLTHSLEVAQLGRRLAEKLVKDDPQTAQAVGGIDPDIVEAACLAHDIGHPPFGHVAEKELLECLKRKKVRSGFDGNAQSFRIVTKLAHHPPSPIGLNLTRATLNAILKYPWLRDTPSSPPLKWGAYDSEFLQLRFTRKGAIAPDQSGEESQWAGQFVGERELSIAELDWARRNSALRDLRKCPEAVLMDWADDVTYAVHDAHDFYAAGLIPLDRLTSKKDDSERQRFFEEVFERHKRAHFPIPHSRVELERAFAEIILLFPLLGPCRGTIQQRRSLIEHSSVLIGRYINGVLLDKSAKNGGEVRLDPEHEKEVFMLKQLTWTYVILQSKLATQQHGQRRIIRELFDVYCEAAEQGGEELTVFPPSIREQIEGNSSKEGCYRIVSDFISGMGERQAVNTHHKLTGTYLGSVLDGLTE
jgi:dGTPase